MSDSFADLWSSSTPLQPKAKSQTLSAAASGPARVPLSQAQVQAGGNKPDVFALLAGSPGNGNRGRYDAGLAGGGSSTSQSRTVTPGTNGTGRLSNNTTPAPPTATAKLSGSGGDAFSDLFSSSSRNGKNNENMTLAARLAMESKAKQRQLGGTHSAQNTGTATGVAGGSGGLDAWAGLDTLASGGISLGVGKVTNANVKVKVDDVDDWGLGDFGSGNTSTVTSTARSTATPQSNFDSRPTAPSTSKKGASLWDLDDFAQPPASSITISISTQPREEKKDDFEFGFDSFASPDRDFDFGSREDRDGGREGSRGLLDDDDNGERHDYKEVHGNIPRSSRGGTQNEDEDDILGMLSKPVDVVRDTHTRTQNHDPIPQHSRRPPGRASSPPPHILGQIVEMGFSVQQAREALRVTKDGKDVQAAIESLLNGGGGSSRQSSSPAPAIATTNGVSPRPRGLPKGQKERERERLERERERQRLETSSSPASGSTSQIQPSVAEIQEQADKLLAQASEIGRGMFSKATAFWKEGKEKVVKAYEERSVVGDRPNSRGVGGGKPRWMIEAMEREREQAERDRGLGNVTGGFTDDDEHEEEGGRLWQRQEQQQQQGRPMPEVHKIMQVEAEAEIDLFSSEVNVPVQPTRQASPTGSSHRATPPAPASSRISVPQRTLVSASHTTLTQVLTHKSRGTELFKLGQHAAAAEAYTASINLLPKSHLLLVPLLTNRALARLKTGEYAGVVGDCLIAVGVVVGGDDGSKDRETVGGDDFGVDDPLAPKKPTLIRSPTVLDVSILPPDLIRAGKSKLNEGGWRHPQGIGVDLVDGYVKAVKRAAEALEGKEKWEEAGVWWGVLGRVGEAGWLDEKTKKETVGAGVRCRKMVEGSASAGSVTTSKPKPKPASRRPPITTTTASSSEPSKALQALKHSTAQAEAEDNAKHELKDIVDARIEKWKAGKEGNIRALLASLESVLWEGTSGVEGLRMGMKDVVSPAQVKKGYVKAIARVHPDKLNANNSTVEQRMLANGVFGTLNEAWISFQGTQK